MGDKSDNPMQLDLFKQPVPWSTIQRIRAAEEKKNQPAAPNPTLLRLTKYDLLELNNDSLGYLLSGIYNIRIPRSILEVQNYWETFAQIYSAGKLKSHDRIIRILPRDFDALGEELHLVAHNDNSALCEKLNFGYLKFEDLWKTRMERVSGCDKEDFTKSFFSPYKTDFYRPEIDKDREGYVNEVFSKLDKIIV